MSTPRFASLLLLAAASLAACDRDPTVDPGPAYPPRGEVVSGDLQQDTVGDRLPQLISIRVTDQEGDPIAGQTVSFVVTAGGGSLFAATSQTSADGVASNQWTLGTVAGDTQRVEARMIDPESGQPVVLATFRAVGVPDAPAAVTALPPVSRTGGAGQTLADSLAVRVTDAFGNPVPGVPIVWSATGGGTVSPATGTTNAQGIAKAAWTLGTTVGVQQTAAASLSPAVRAEFTAVASVPLSAVLVKVAGDGQTGTVGQALASGLTVELRTAAGQRISGALVHWTPAAGSGSASPGSGATDGTGQASTVWTLGTTPGPQQITASVDGAAPVAFTATAGAGPAAQLAKIGGDAQTAPPNAPLPQALTVQVRDAYGNPLQGVTVNWAAASGGGSIVPTQSQTNAIGQTSVQWTLGPAVGAQTATATAGGMTVTFTATAQIGPLDHIEVTPAAVSFTSLTATAQLQARPVDAYGNTVPGVSITWGTLDLAVATVSASGLVTSTGNGATQIRAFGGGKTGEADVTVQQVPASVVISGGRTTIVQFDTTQWTATVRDARNQPIAGAAVTWSTSSPALATVTQTGLITGVGPGAPSITATASGGAAASRTLTVAAALRADTLAMGARHGCVIDPGGTAYCFGSNLGRQIAFTGANSSGPRAIPGHTFVAITAGDAWTPYEFYQSHTCGIDPAGEAWCWGDNESGQLGYDDGRTFDRSTVTVCESGFEYTFICTETPHEVPGGPWGQIDAGANHTCAITTAGAAYCWGKNNYGQLGTTAADDECWFYPVFGGETSFACALTPRAVTGGLTFRQVGAGEDFTCGLTTGGAAYCWGRNNAGQLGDGTTTNRSVPTAVLGGLTFARLSVGRMHACGVTSGGTVYCWGSNARGQIGIGTIGGNRTTPVAVTGTYTTVSAGKFHTCALDTSGRVWCWGENENRQLNDGTNVDRPSPTPTVPTPRVFVDVGISAVTTCAREEATDAIFCGSTWRPVAGP